MSRPSARLALAFLVVAPLAAPGCGSATPTSMLIDVESALLVPTDLDGLRIQVVGADSGGMLDQTFELTTPFPATYRVYPRAGHESESVAITVDGTRGGARRIRRVVTAAFRPGAEIRVRVDLADDCLDVSCPPGIDCVSGRCVSILPDGGLDAGRLDGGAPDAGCGGGCDDGVPCTSDSCVMGACAHTADDSLCPSGQVCNIPGGCGAACGTAADCDDGQTCNGVEVCTDRRCGPGAPVDCDDAIACTIDGCDEGVGGCTHATDDTACDNGNPCDGAEACDLVLDCQPAPAPLDCGDGNDCTDDSCTATGCDHQTADRDMDGHGDLTCPAIGSVPADDCDDTTPARAPGAPELCNGLDDDCDMLVDETSTCAAGTIGTCMTSCGSMGSRTCSAACGWSVCSAPAEVCNGLDDDCNGAADDGFSCIQGSVRPCTTSCGSTGTRACDGACTLEACVEPAEICGDGIDQDCDGRDNGCVPCTTNAECDDTLPCNGVETCEPGRTGSFCQPGPPPVCDDGIRCTVDACDDVAGGCVAPPDDRFCADTNFCNGDEVCVAGSGCRAGIPPSCVDGSACTDEACVGTSPGMCVLSTHDADGDAHGAPTCAAVGGIPADDCNDADPDVYPGAPELCNGIDDDCAAGCDDRFACCRGSSGTCTTSCGTTGSRVCSAACSWGVCSPPPEVCNGIDDDCNTACDDGFACCAGTTGACTTACGTTGTRTCSGTCGWGACTVPAEVCNGIDDDCDGVVDDGFTCASGASGTCTTGCGTTGTRTCSAACGWSACTPPDEVCNGADDNCNAMCDDGFSCCRGSSSSCTTSCGSTGSRLCGASCTWAACAPPAETCNGLDDDCNGMPDETFACVRGATGPCTASCGTTGTRVCSGSCAWGACAPPAEVCNGLDDDCDGTSDDGFTCAVGATRSCATSCGTTGSQTCSASCGWGACVPPPEACNGIDDDCNTIVDDSLQCVSGSMGSCTTTCGSAGSRSCGAMCTWSACTPPAETCNGLDDDCDASVDDGFACASGSSGACTASCGSTGSRTCSASCAWGACSPPAEVCNGLDDDCDTMPDDGFACVRSSSGSCTTSCGSTGSRMCGGTCTWGACAPPVEVCNGLDDDCDTLLDDGFTCAAGATSSCLSSCGTTGSRTCTGACAWGACAPPAEVCNGADDDCDGLSDDGFSCAAGSSGSCTSSCGTTGSRTCNASCAWGSCNPPAELCNGLDDDCDTMVDDGFACSPGATSSCTTGCGTTGSRTCSASCTWGACSPPAETCNGADDDCDVAVDETFSCPSGGTGACTASCGTTGSRMCSAACSWGACAPPTELCNGADDDCDTLCDDGFACCRGSVGSCTTGCGSTGSRSCSSSCTWDTCNPPAETCNGADDDCDTMCDDGFTCCAGTTSACTASCGTTGSRTCSAGSCTWGACAPPAELCNGIDDDCDTTCDDGFSCCVGTTSACTTSCGSTGSRLCSAACAYGACTPPGEQCSNGADDDCDTLVDAADPDCAGPCPGATVIAAPGGRYTAALVPHVYTGTCGGAGAEAYFTFTLAMASDVFLATHQTAGIDTFLYVRSGSCGGASVDCNADADTLTTSRLTLTNLAPGTYNVFVDTAAGVSSGMVTLDAYITTPGTASDRCGNPTFIAPATASIAGSTCGFGSDYVPVADGVSCFGISGTTGDGPSGGAEDRVYAFYVPTARTVTFSGCGGTTNYDTSAWIRSVCTDGTLAAQPVCDDDACSGLTTFCTSPGWRSTVTTTIGPGLYYFFADAYRSSSCATCGNFTYAITGL